LELFVGGDVDVVAVLDRPMYLLGYVSKENRVYLIDKERDVVSFTLHLSVMEFQSLVMKGDLATAQQNVLPRVPKDMRPRVAKFLEHQGYKRMALEISTDEEHAFELAVALFDLKRASELAASSDSKTKWKALGDVALHTGDFELAVEALTKAEDWNGLLLLRATTNDVKELKELVEVTKSKRKHNVAFTAAYLLKDFATCVELLVETNRLPEAALFARSYCPRLLSSIAKQWKKHLQGAGGAANIRTADQIADPSDYANLFAEVEGLHQVNNGKEENVGGSSTPTSGDGRTVVKSEQQKEKSGVTGVEGEVVPKGESEEKILPPLSLTTSPSTIKPPSSPSPSSKSDAKKEETEQQHEKSGEQKIIVEERDELESEVPELDTYEIDAALRRGSPKSSTKVEGSKTKQTETSTSPGTATTTTVATVEDEDDFGFGDDDDFTLNSKDD